MNIKKMLVPVGLLLASILAQASPWQSLGRVNSLIAYPNTTSCQHRVINHYWSNKPIYYPSVVNVYSPDNINFVFHQDMRSLSNLTSNSVALSKFKTAVDFYNTRTGAKSISGIVAVGIYPRVSIQVEQVDSQGLVQGNGWGIDPSELKWYELQEACPA